jgi:hypothetical protein
MMSFEALKIPCKGSERSPNGFSIQSPPSIVSSTARASVDFMGAFPGGPEMGGEGFSSLLVQSLHVVA